jgi:hypothetical protein
MGDLAKAIKMLSDDIIIFIIFNISMSIIDLDSYINPRLIQKQDTIFKHYNKLSSINDDDKIYIEQPNPKDHP